MAKRKRSEDFEAPINQIVKILSGKLKKGTLTQGTDVYFNILSSLNTRLLLDIYKVQKVETIELFCNQNAFMLRVIMNEDAPIGGGIPPPLNLAEILLLEKKLTFTPPSPKSLKFAFSDIVYKKLNDILKLVLFVLHRDNVQIESASYKQKKPFYHILITTNNKRFDSSVLFKLTELSKEIVQISISYDTICNCMVLLVVVSIL